MTPARRVLCGLLLFMGGAQPALAQTPGSGDRSVDACPATLTNVRRKCGCEPREEAVFNSLAQTKLNSDNLRSQVTYCLQSDGNLNVTKIKLGGNVALNGCLARMENQYPEYRETLAELVKATKDVPSRKLEVWLGCYERELGGPGALGSPPRTPTPPPAPAKSTRATGGRTGATAASRPSSTPVSSPGIEQRVEADGNSSIATEGVEATHDGKSGSATIRQVIKASDKGVITTGPIKAHVGH